ncbi:hypothetical protein C0J52_22828 [Blattella germanica]|nr:hypothetical protein C0J52_22828 [Blattella germanica]
MSFHIREDIANAERREDTRLDNGQWSSFWFWSSSSLLAAKNTWRILSRMLMCSKCLNVRANYYSQHYDSRQHFLYFSFVPCLYYSLSNSCKRHYW